jgi:predicted MFS family arabinose efflux permease
VTPAPRIHFAWIVLAALTLCMMASSGLRSVFGVYIKPMEAEFGWSRGALSGAAAISLLLLGATGPLVGRLADRWAPRSLILTSLAVLAAGALGSSLVRALWHVYVTAGLLMALGAGGVAMTTAAALIARWFESRQGLAVGIAAGGMSAGQLVVIPLATALTVWFGWRASFFWLGISVLALVLPIALALIRNTPEERGLRPYGAAGAVRAAAGARPADTEARVSLTEAARRPQFWLLVATFFVCGFTTSGFVLTHFMPHALEHNFTEFQASSALGVMGAMNVLGTMGSGWLCDRFGRRGPLVTYYFVRGLSLFFLLWVWDVPSLHVWAALFGLNFISTVPPTTTLTARIFGRRSVGELTGWIFFSHQVGGAIGAALTGWMFEWTGSYASAITLGGVLAVVAAGLTLLIREAPVRARPLAPAPATT